MDGEGTYTTRAYSASVSHRESMSMGTRDRGASVSRMNIEMSRSGRSHTLTSQGSGTHDNAYNVSANDTGLDDIGEDEGDDDDDDDRHHKHKHAYKQEVLESFDFNDQESLAWRKHQYRRFFQGKGVFWNSSRSTTFWNWFLVAFTGLMVAFTGAFVAVFTEELTGWKLESCYKLMEEGNHSATFFAYHFLSLFLVLCSGALCYYQPAAAGSGIPEIKAYLNGVNLNSVVKMPVLVAKVLGMCFSCAAGLPLGKEGPMIHAGSIIGAAVSQGYTVSIGFDNSWTNFQDFRNDHTKRDFVTFGAAAGVAAAFRAPIGGILFTLEEGASFWSTSLTFKAFICAVITQLMIGIIFPEEATNSASMFAFGKFENYYDGRANFFTYELPLFVLMGVVGGIFGALFNYINEVVSLYRKKYINMHKWKRMIELCLITLLMAFISYILSICWQVCTPIPYDSGVKLTKQELYYFGHLVHFQCKHDEYNQLASIYFTSGDMAMRQLFHFRELNGVGFDSFTTGPLILFFIPYFLMAAITSGVMCPAGLFVPTLLSGAAFGRLIGHWMNVLFPGYVADSGTYALIGAAAILGGMARMTIAGCVIVLEACGNITYLLPLMVTFAAARYTGNAINESMYDMQIHLKEMPFLEGSLHSLGLLNYHPISEIMTTNPVTIREVEKVGRVLEILQHTKHNGFPVVSVDGKLRGLILRKTLCGLLKNKAYSTPSTKHPVQADGGIVLQQSANISYDTLERQYPNYPDVKSIKFKNEKDLNYWLDVRAYMDTAVNMLAESCSIRRCYLLFRTMGLRHLVVVDGELRATGIITRANMNEHHLKHYWEEEGAQLQKEMNMDSLPPAVVYETAESRSRSGTMASITSVDLNIPEIDPEILKITMDEEQSDSPTITLRKTFIVNDERDKIDMEKSKKASSEAEKKKKLVPSKKAAVTTTEVVNTTESKAASADNKAPTVKAKSTKVSAPPKMETIVEVSTPPPSGKQANPNIDAE